MDDALFQMTREIKSLSWQIERLKAQKNEITPGAIYATFLALPSLRGFWPLNIVDANSWYHDVTNNNLLLTNNNGAPPTVYNNLVSYVDFNGSNQSLSRADEAVLDITGAITFGGWFWTDLDTGALQMLMTKDSSGSGTRGFNLYVNTNEAINVEIWTSDASGVGVSSPNGAWTHGAWHFVVARFTPSTAVYVYLDGTLYTQTTAIASIQANTTPFTIGIWGDVTNYLLNGRAALCFLCADDAPDNWITYLFNISRGLFGV